MEPLRYEDFKTLTATSKRAFHLEQRDTYQVEAEDEPFRKWIHGEPDDYAWYQDWAHFVRQVTAAGVQVQRVRVVSVPHVVYTRWGLDVAPLSIEAGEDIRYLPRHLAEDIRWPDEDYWLLDDSQLILSIFSDDGRTGGFGTETSPELLRQCRIVRDQVWERAIPYAQYVV